MTKITLLLLLFPIFSFSQWTQIGYDIDGEKEFDHSGWSTSISSDGSIVAIGAKDNDSNGVSSGHVRVYENISGIWNQIGADIDGDFVNDLFGFSVSLNSNGNILAVGAHTNNGNGTNSGQVRVFENVSNTWTQIGSDIYGEAAFDTSGVSISLSSDGTIIAIGAPSNTGINGAVSGHVRVFKNISGVWTQIGEDIDGEAFGDNFGDSVSLNSNGTIVGIGAPNNDAVNGTASGHVRIYENISGTWTQIGVDIEGEAAYDAFGSATSLNSDGNIIAIGAEKNDGIGPFSGHVRVYENIRGVWTQLGLDIDGEVGDALGASVSLNSNGNIVAIGSPSNNNGQGKVGIYQNIAGTWTRIDSNIDGEAAGDGSGFSVSLSSDGSTVVIGAIGNDGNGSDSGHVRVYTNLVLSIEDNTFGRKFMVYPNPSVGLSIIQLGESYNEVSVNIFNVLGNQVSAHTFSDTNVIDLNTQQFTAGVYFVKVVSGTKKATVKLVIK